MDPKKMSPEELEQLIHRELRALPSRKAPEGFEARFQAKLAARQPPATLAADPLEQAIHRELRALPLRPAPATLEPRVRAELERRAALPWWRKSFAHWPVAARGGFLVLSAAFAAMLVWVLAGFDTKPVLNAVAADFAWVATVRGITESIINFTTIVIRDISPVWLYGAIAVVVGLYATLFGLGTAAYRTLFANR